MSDFDADPEALVLKMLQWKGRAERAEARVAALEAALEASQRTASKLSKRAESSQQVADRLSAYLESRDSHVERLVKEAIASRPSTYAATAREESTATSTRDSPTEPYRARNPKKEKLDPDARYELLCQMAARARCARKNLSPSARQRMIEFARAIDALPAEQEEKARAKSPGFARLR